MSNEGRGVVLDGIDKKILEVLANDARSRAKSVSRQAGIKRTTANYRMLRFDRETKVIRKYTIIPDYENLGLPINAYIMIKFQPHIGITQRQLANELVKLESVTEVHLAIGEADILLKVRQKSDSRLIKFLVDILREIPGIQDTRTIICAETLKEEAFEIGGLEIDEDWIKARRQTLINTVKGIIKKNKEKSAQEV